VDLKDVAVKWKGVAVDELDFWRKHDLHGDVFYVRYSV
jgi:hypothetical protein